MSWSRLVAPLFVLIWSTGFIVARYGLPYADAGWFLCLRFGGVLLVMLPFTLGAGAPWPNRRQTAHMALAGVLMQAAYLGGVWSAIKLGMGAGLAALIVGLQPILTAVAGQWLGDRPSARQWLGLLVGLGGVVLVVGNRLGNHGVTPATLAWVILALVAITFGTLYQRRYCTGIDLRTGSFVQFAASLLVILPLSLLFESQQVAWTPSLFGALAWSIFALSIGATSLLFVLLRRGAATNVASLMYLTPATTALMAWALFGEPLTVSMMLGMALTALGVVMARTPAA